MTNDTRPTVHVVDDDEPVRRGLAMLLRSAGHRVATHESGLAFLDAYAAVEGGIGCVLTDVRMPGLDGLGLLRHLREAGFGWPIIVMTAHGDISTAVHVMKQGAADFIEKPFDDDVLLATIAAAMAAMATPGDGSAVPFGGAGGAGSDGSAEDAADRIGALSPRERQVLDLLSDGKPNKVVAHELGLSPRTVEVHRARLLARLGVRSLAEAVRLVVRAERAGDGLASARRGG